MQTMATYTQIQGYVKGKYGFVVKTCWIADVKEQCGLHPKKAHNRESAEYRQNPCPSEKVESIKEALKNFDMI